MSFTAIQPLVFVEFNPTGDPSNPIRVEIISKIKHLWKNIKTITEEYFGKKPHSLRGGHSFFNHKTAVGGELNANYIGLQLIPYYFVASRKPRHDQDIIAEFWSKLHYCDSFIVDLQDTFPAYLQNAKWEMKFEDKQFKFITLWNRFGYLKVKNWTDGEAISVEDLHQCINHMLTYGKSSFWVHCRAGHGRTGTLICAFFLRYYIDTHQINEMNFEERIVNIITMLRQDRAPHFVHKEKQFTLLYNYGLFLLAQR